MSSTNACEQASCDTMPDIAKQPHVGPKGTLNWVGMSEIEIPIYVLNSKNERMQTLAHVQAYVNLQDPNSKGIHMSRLYLALDNQLGMGELSPKLMTEVVENFVTSHEGLSDAAYLECRFNYFERRNSLLSDNTGWKNYPVRVVATVRDGVATVELALNITYSSTCPCSAALARQLIQKGFQERFGEGAIDAQDVYEWLGTAQGVSATPHSQRSIAQVRVKLSSVVENLPISDLIDLVEEALQTPVQAAVKREDEQEFARLNAANLMFCEDAARRVKAALDMDSNLDDFWVRVNHLESLHAHDAVAVVTKGIENGYDDDPREYISGSI